MARKIIDMRSRPAFLHDFYGASPGTKEYDVARWLNRRVGSKDDEHFVRSHSLEGFLAEIDAAGISSAVVVGRETPSLTVDNDRIAALTGSHPQLIAIGSIDPQTRGIKGAIAEIERAVKQLGMKAINLEPGFGSPPLKADDALLFPLYDACDQLGVPVCLMSGPTSPALEFTDPAPLARVARAFPRLPIVCYHGFYPYVNEVIGIAFRYENIHLVPDMYIFLPGGNYYVEAANGFLADQLLFGTSYPFRAMGQTVEDYLRLGFRDAVIERVMHGNAERVLRLGV